jgi:hypothetical protein
MRGKSIGPRQPDSAYGRRRAQREEGQSRPAVPVDSPAAAATGDDEVLVSLHHARDRVCSALRQATERAQDAGVISAHVVWQDLPFIAGAVAATPATCLGLQRAPDLRGRILTAELDGLRACPDRA